MTVKAKNVNAYIKANGKKLGRPLNSKTKKPPQKK